MKEFINSLTGTRMLVADGRAEEYLAAGHRPAGADQAAKSGRQESAPPPAEEKPAAAPAPQAKKAAPKQKPAAKK